MSVPATSSVSLPAVAPATPGPSASGSDNTAFARMLSAEQRGNAAGPPPPARPQDAAARRDARDVPRHASGSQDASSGKTDKPAAEAAPADARTGDADDPARGDAARDAACITDPALANWMAGLHPQAAPATAATADGNAAHDAPADGLHAHARTIALAPAATDPSAAAGPPRADKAGERPGPELPATPLATHELAQSFAEELASHGKEDTAATRLEGLEKIDLSPAHLPAGVHAAPPAEPGAAASTVASVDVPTPVTSPDFREALGVQVSVLARDGVQHAELHLNPADMGPISVQIALDGTRAQVDFGAASSMTRQAIEAGLPELAAALRDAGFTLAGGGVSQHPRGQSQGGDARETPPERSGRIADAPAARRVTVRSPQGAVDLYA